ncbi:GLE1-like protein [Rhizoctonia solani]|uniref:mRNA export factor GLE1 n=1 Tax=Rhizoctonia solani TaxID=456999 RepID=A0A8H7I7I9_9AGAM|nr:GLE1-like protein [Rhizoctonia solani]
MRTPPLTSLRHSHEDVLEAHLTITKDISSARTQASTAVDRYNQPFTIISVIGIIRANAVVVCLCVDCDYLANYGRGLFPFSTGHRDSIAPATSDRILAPIPGVERNYHSYEEAARQACLYILTGKIDSGPIDKQTPLTLTLSRYTSVADQPSWIKGKTVGLGYKETSNSDPIDIIRLEYDPAKKFYFSVQALNQDRTAVDYTKVRLVAKFPSSDQNPDQYFQALVEPLDRKRANNTNEYEYSPGKYLDLWRTEKTTPACGGRQVSTMRFSVSRSPSPVQRTTRRPTNAYSIHNLTDDEEESSSSSESEEPQVLSFSHAGRDTSMTLSRALTRSNANPNPDQSIDAFLNAVRLRSRVDPLEEYQNAERAMVKSSSPPAPSLPHLSCALTQSHLALQAKRNEQEMSAVLAMVERLDIQRKGREEEGMKRVKEGNRGIWEEIEGAIRRDEEKRGEEEERKGAGDERKRQEKEAREKAEKEKAEDEARKDAEEKAAKDAQEARAVQASQASAKSVPAIQEWETAWAERAALKNLTRAVEESSELKSVAGRLRRKLRTRVGQVTNSQSELAKLADAIHDIISPSPPHPAPVYTALLSAFSKYLLLQAETEVTAKLPTAYPLARLVWLVVARGHTRLWEIFWARPNRRMGSRRAYNSQGRSNVQYLACVLTPHGSLARNDDSEWRKMIGRELEGKNDPDDKPPTLETTSQYTDRMVGQLALYAAILQTSPMPAHVEPDSVPAQFRLAKLWTWLARVLNSVELLREAVGKGAGGEGETGARVRLGLMVERWEKEGKFGLEGRNVER